MKIIGQDVLDDAFVKHTFDRRGRETCLAQTFESGGGIAHTQ